MAALYKCRGVSTVAGEQLLLDAHQIKELLLGMHSLDLENTISAPTSYTKYVQKGMGKAEMLLKVVMSPTQPPQVMSLSPPLAQLLSFPPPSLPCPAPHTPAHLLSPLPCRADVCPKLFGVDA